MGSSTIHQGTREGSHSPVHWVTDYRSWKGLQNQQKPGDWSQPFSATAGKTWWSLTWTDTPIQRVSEEAQASQGRCQHCIGPKCTGEGHGHPLQYSCLENPMDRGAWGATVHGVTKGQTGLSHWPRREDSRAGWCWRILFLSCRIQSTEARPPCDSGEGGAAKEADQNVRGHLRDVVPTGCAQEPGRNRAQQPLGKRHRRIDRPPGSPGTPSSLRVKPTLPLLCKEHLRAPGDREGGRSRNRLGSAGNEKQTWAVAPPAGK